MSMQRKKRAPTGVIATVVALTMTITGVVPHAHGAMAKGRYADDVQMKWGVGLGEGLMGCQFGGVRGDNKYYARVSTTGVRDSAGGRAPALYCRIEGCI